MKKVTFLLIIFSVILAGCSTSSAIGPQISLEKKSINLGFITLEDLPSQTVQVTNNGSELLKITGISTSCGCTSAEIDNKEIEPGSSAELKITFDPKVHNTTGFFKRYVYINSNDPKGEQEIEVKVNVK